MDDDELNFFQDVLQRWKKENEEDTYGWIRRTVAARALYRTPAPVNRPFGGPPLSRRPPSAQLLSFLAGHSDLQVRCGYYTSFQPSRPEEIDEAFEKDGKEFVEAAIDNEYFYRSVVPRAVRRALWKYLDKV